MTGNKTLIEICRFKLVANNDEEKLRQGKGCITLSSDKPCFPCDGSREYAEKINCNCYLPKYIEGKAA